MGEKPSVAEGEIQEEVAEKARTREEVMKVLEERGMVVPDTYDYSSLEIQDELPIMFHGTSAHSLEEIKRNGLTGGHVDFNELADKDDLLRYVFKHQFRVKSDLSEKNKSKHEQNIHLTMVYGAAMDHAHGSEQIGRAIYGLDENDAYEGEIRKKLTDPEYIKKAYADDDKIRDLLLAAVDKKPAVLKIKLKFSDLDLELNRNYGGDCLESLFDMNVKKRLLAQSKEALRNYKIYLKEWRKTGKAPKGMGLDIAGSMWTNIGDLQNVIQHEAELEYLTPANVLECAMRRWLYEILFASVPPEKIINLDELIDAN